jgi:hypothetical protein
MSIESVKDKACLVATLKNARRFRGFVQNFLFGTVQGEVENVVVA